MNMNNSTNNTKKIIHNLQMIIEQRSASAMAELAEKRHPADIAAVFNVFNQAQQVLLLQLASPKVCANLFRYLTDELQASLVQQLDKTTLSALLVHMAADERADLYNLLDETQQAAILPALALAKREDMRTLAAYDKAKVGAVMTSDYTRRPPIRKPFIKPMWWTC